jgi:methyl-accepting chemotaxis protein
MWGSIIENFSKFKVSQNLENVKRISDYEQARFKKGDVRLEKIFREAELLSQREQETLREVLKSVNRSLVPKIAVLVFFIFLGGIFVSHKIAGPLYRFEKSAEAIRQGDLSVSFKIRKTDALKSTASTLEEMTESLRSDIEKLKSSGIALSELADSIKGEISQEKIQRLYAIINDISIALSKYKL